MQCDFIFFNKFEKFFILIGNIDYFKLMRNYLLISLLLISGVVSAETMKEGVLTNVKKLTDSSEKFENPKWSPDGSLIAFTNYGYNNLYVMDANGENMHRISSATSVGFGYEWDADSKHIFATDLRHDMVAGKKIRKQALWSISTGGDSEKLSEDFTRMNMEAKLATRSFKQKRAARAAQKVSLSCEREGLYVISGSGQKTLINAGASFCPALSPDGSKVAFNHGNYVCVVNIDGSGKIKLDHGFNPTWANNSQVVYEQSTDDGHTYTSSDLFIIRALQYYYLSILQNQRFFAHIFKIHHYHLRIVVGNLNHFTFAKNFMYDLAMQTYLVNAVNGELGVAHCVVALWAISWSLRLRHRIRA